ncbi:isopentenyl-diphosphate Delta-isomerase [Microbacterium sp. SD291]|uniref:isopentenyl-diphosphate Delta-isomerase n=1 Tax=Microbacterium sp. SD291 TaxID=2782007 RepID=UPI001A97A9EE|nr:isopentenyl-diphosphate Delta-isomerase [Microbacterium sp. SD291]MBO0980017.1 isopentenyl-diphosphate Delta-isomerase [Microbacterium sp. SD291]
MDDVTLLAVDGTPIGTMPKDQVHTTETPLHLAFSCHVFDAGGRMLVTRRSLAKRTWPGVWTNSFCGHPRPGEEMADAVRRRAREELGIGLTGLTMLIPDYRYRAVDASGIVENEHCPVHIAVIDGDLAPSAEEVAEWVWADPGDLSEAASLAPFAFSPWFREQLPLLRDLGGF